MSKVGVRLGRVFLLSALLSACAYHPRAETAHVPTPGWECTVGQRGQSEFTATAILDQQGRQLHAEWRWYTMGKVLSFGLEGSVLDERQPRERDSVFDVHWRRPAPPGTPSETFRLTMTSDPDAGVLYNGLPFSGVATGDGAVLRANWLDTQALARGAEKLFLVVRDVKGQVVDRHEFPRDILGRGTAAVTAGLDNLEAKKSGYRTQCYYTEDLAPDVIIT
jgi:hypothetical protein